MLPSSFLAASLSLLLLVLANCTPSRTTASADTCVETGTVQDYSGLDGCQLLLFTHDGKKLLVGKISVPDFQLAVGQRLRFSYRVLENVASICMAEDAIVELTCVQVVGSE